jgi:hypothetical protein
MKAVAMGGGAEDITEHARVVHRLSGTVYYAQPDKGSTWLVAPTAAQIGSVAATPVTFRHGASGHLYLVRPGHSLRDTLSRARSDLRAPYGASSRGPTEPKKSKIPTVAAPARQLAIPGTEADR